MQDSLVEVGAEFPVNSILSELKKSLATNNCVILSAPPGAGKSTIVPLALLNDFIGGDSKIIMLQPRRAAVKAVARRISTLFQQKTGALVGWQIRGEKCLSKATRIEIVTEGILIRKLINDPDLTGYSMIIFDEFHERGIHSDFGLTIALDIQKFLRPELKILVMSATLDVEKIKTFLNAPVVTCNVRKYPVEISYSNSSLKYNELNLNIAKTALDILKREHGGMLIFLPGAYNINAVAAIMMNNLPTDVVMTKIYGNLSSDEQDFALTPAAPGYRKLVLATNIAETSLTIQGIRIVIDSGYVKKNIFDLSIGLPALKTVRISKASAEQRSGRAGRLMPGICIRMWTEFEHRALSDYDSPEITVADLTPLCLDLAAWGSQPQQLNWLDAPPDAALIVSNELLMKLGAIDSQLRLTKLGREMSALPIHPRLAAMILHANTLNLAPLAAEIAAVIEERSMLFNDYSSSVNLNTIILYMRQFNDLDNHNIRRDDYRRFAVIRNQLLQLMGCKYSACNIELTGVLLAYAYPDRIAKKRQSGGLTYLLTSGRGASLAEYVPIVTADWLVAAKLDAGAVDAKIMLAAAISEDCIYKYFTDQISTNDEIIFDNEKKQLSLIKTTKLGAITLKTTTFHNPDSMTYQTAVLQVIRKYGFKIVSFDAQVMNILQRLQYAHNNSPNEWLDWSDAGLITRLEEWLMPFLSRVKTFNDVMNVNFSTAIIAAEGYAKIKKLDNDYPERFTVPSGNTVKIDYSGNVPEIAVKIQEMYGCKLHPAIKHGSLKLKVSLLSPASRPVQITSDITSFWRGSWELVKKEMKGRYPKHFWPDSPENAIPLRSGLQRRAASPEK